MHIFDSFYSEEFCFLLLLWLFAWFKNKREIYIW